MDNNFELSRLLFAAKYSFDEIPGDGIGADSALSRSQSSLEGRRISRKMASTIEKVLFGAGLGLAGTAAIYLYKERKREEQEREGSNVNMDTPQSKARVFPFTKTPGSWRIQPLLEDDKKEKVEVPEEDPKQSPEKGVNKEKVNRDSKEGEDDSGNEKPKRSLIEDAKTALHKTKEALHGGGREEKKEEEEVGLFSWFMGRQKAEEEGAEDKKNEEKKE